MGHFLSDLDKSCEAVDLVKKLLEDQGLQVRELEKAEQKMGDLEVKDAPNPGISYVEVKYDMRARRSGNLCFEMSNGTRETGIMETQADFVYYVVPSDGCKMVFIFEIEKLKEYIQDPANVKMAKGGDKRKFDLALVKIEKVIADGLAMKCLSIGN